MPNTLLTIDKVTKAAIAVLHNKLNFVTNINRGYDDNFGVSGAKIGDSVRIRKPAKYTVRSGTMTMSAQATNESSVTLALNQISGVDLEFTDKDLALSINEFSDLILEPACSAIAADIESKVIAKAIAGAGGGIVTASPSAADFLKANAMLTSAGHPLSQRGAWLAPFVEAGIVDALKGVFNDVKTVSEQYLDGKMGRALGLDWYGNAHIPAMTNSADVAGAVKTTITVQGADKFVGKSLGNASEFPAGTILTIAGLNAVNPETGVDLGVLKTWVVQETCTADSTGDVTLKLSEPINSTGSNKNTTGLPTADAVVTILGDASSIYNNNIVAHKDFMVFGTADLTVPSGTDMAYRTNYDGLSIRLVRDYNISSGEYLARLDIIWGATILRSSAGVLVNSKV